MDLTRKAIHPVYIFNGLRYYRKPNGYYKRDIKDGGTYLHRDMWVAANGCIPGGHQIHHIDHDNENNVLSNLVCLPKKAHASYHLEVRRITDPGKLREALQRAIAASKDWHRSEAGRRWHREHARKTGFGKRARGDAICPHCREPFLAWLPMTSDQRGFCSAKCQSAARRASGVDNETRHCRECGNPWIVNKYSKARCCSVSCGAKRARTRLDLERLTR